MHLASADVIADAGHSLSVIINTDLAVLFLEISSHQNWLYKLTFLSFSLG